MSNPPDKIYLQWEEYGSEGVTWSHDRVNDSDMEYVLAKPTVSHMETMDEMIRGVMEEGDA